MRLYLGVRPSRLTSQRKATFYTYYVTSHAVLVAFLALVVPWFSGFSGSRGSLVLVVLVVLWFSWFSGSRGSRGSLVLWFSWFSGSRGSLVLVVLVVPWFSWFPGSRGSLVPWFSWFSWLSCRFSRSQSWPVGTKPWDRFSKNMAAINMCFTASLLVFIGCCCAVILDEPTKSFIQIVLENAEKEGTYISTGPFRAFPRGQYIRTGVGESPMAFLVPDVILWDPLSLFPDLFLFCPSCDVHNREYLHATRWKDGSTAHDQPRTLYGLRNDVLLVEPIHI